MTVIGSENYLAEDNFEKKTKIKLKINNYLQLQYRQYKQINFIKNLSIIDVIANLGWQKTSNYVKEKI